VSARREILLALLIAPAIAAIVLLPSFALVFWGF